METTIVIKVPAVPMAQPRQRTRVMNVNGKAVAQNYTPKTGKPANFKATVRMAAAAVYAGPPLDCALCVDIDWVLPRPSSKRWKSKPMPRYWHTTKPDRDNLDKACLDALSGLVWTDDKLVCDGRLRKLVAAGDEQPHVLITISPIDPTP